MMERLFFVCQPPGGFLQRVFADSGYFRPLKPATTSTCTQLAGLVLQQVRKKGDGPRDTCDPLFSFLWKTLFHRAFTQLPFQPGPSASQSLFNTAMAGGLQHPRARRKVRVRENALISRMLCFVGTYVAVYCEPCYCEPTQSFLTRAYMGYGTSQYSSSEQSACNRSYREGKRYIFMVYVCMHACANI